METWRRVIFVLIGFFESLIFSGLIFGWPSLVYVLQVEGVYSHLCDAEDQNSIPQNGELMGNITENSTGNFSTIEDVAIKIIKCKAQDKMFGLLYSIMLAAFGIPSVLIGFSLDYWGLRITRLFGNTMVTSGFIFLSFATSQLPWTIWPGMLMICLGANTLRLCALQCSNAWPEKRATIMFLYTSAHAVSTTVFLMFQFANSAGLPLRFSALTITVICILTFVSSFILPKIKVEDHTAKPIVENMKAVPMTGVGDQFPEKNKEEGDNFINHEKPAEPPVVIPLMESIKTLSFALHMIWLINVYMLRFYITSFNTWAWKTTDDASQIAFYNSFAGTCSLISPFISPIGGVVTDYLTAKANKKEDKVERLASKFQAPTLILSLTTTLLLALYTCKLFYSPMAVYISIVVVSIARPITIATVYTYVRTRFYPEHFNRLIGLGFTVISVVCLAHYPMYLWLFNSDESYIVASSTFCIIILLTFTSPLHLLIRKFPLRFAAEEMKNRKVV